MYQVNSATATWHKRRLAALEFDRGSRRGHSWRYPVEARRGRSAERGDAGRLEIFHRARSRHRRSLRRPAHPRRRSCRPGQGLRLRGLYRPPACRALWPRRRPLYGRPVPEGTKQQGPQSPITPAQQYRKALAALDTACRAKFGGKAFADLTDEQKDEAIKGLEDGSLKLDGTDARNSSSSFSPTPRMAFSPIRSMAATRTWRRGK